MHTDTYTILGAVTVLGDLIILKDLTEYKDNSTSELIDDVLGNDIYLDNTNQFYIDGSILEKGDVFTCYVLVTYIPDFPDRTYGELHSIELKWIDLVYKF